MVAHVWNESKPEQLCNLRVCGVWGFPKVFTQFVVYFFVWSNFICILVVELDVIFMTKLCGSWKSTLRVAFESQKTRSNSNTCPFKTLEGLFVRMICCHQQVTMTSHGENVSINKTIQCIERERDHLQRNFILSLTYIFFSCISFGLPWLLLKRQA